ncbi:MAG: S8 family peptidase [Bacteroidetes bacterium]|nr:S8 family peptidase [Bacteroidota bacterium]MCY4204465.1 S8 family peptidase [Bacteroidota bacterium]
MMRHITLFLLLLSTPYIAFAQERTKYWIFLSDKVDIAGKNTQVEEGYLTDNALLRRTLRGQPEAAAMIAFQDAPISRVYEDDLLQKDITIINRSRWLNAVTAKLSEEEAKQIASLSYVRDIRPVAVLSTSTQPNIPVSPLIPERVSSNCPSAIFGNSCNQLDVVNAILPIQRGINGDGVVLGFLDTKFNIPGSRPFTHTSLKHIPDDGRLMEVRDFTERDPAQPCGGTNTHGMSVASVAVGYDEGDVIGPGYGASIYAASTECSPYERNIEEDNFVMGVEWMESEGVDVITSSLGYLDFDDDPGQRNYTGSDLDGDTGLTTIIMDWAAQRGIVTVTSAGNGGPGPQTLGTPADGDSVIAVGGVRPTKELWFSSSRGPTADGRIKPDVSGQASRVLVASGASGYGASAGTSFSAPMIAGIVTQILQVNPGLGPMDVWQVLTSTASQSGSPDNDLGWGIVDADAAIKSAILLNSTQDLLPSPDKLIIHTPYPNPFYDVAHFIIESVEPITHAQLKIFDVLGREIATVHSGSLQTGGTPIQFDGRHLRPGVYAYILEYDGKLQSGIMTRLGQ